MSAPQIPGVAIADQKAYNNTTETTEQKHAQI